MIFASFGNSPVPFTRMAEALENLAHSIDEEIIVQNGFTEFRFEACRAISFMDKETFMKHLTTCSVAILQGGWGGISEASDRGVRMVVIPRIKGVEHYHDQEQLVRALEKEHVCIGCYDVKDLVMKVEMAKYYDFRPICRGNAADLINEFIGSMRL